MIKILKYLSQPWGDKCLQPQRRLTSGSSVKVTHQEGSHIQHASVAVGTMVMVKPMTGHGWPAAVVPVVPVNLQQITRVILGRIDDTVYDNELMKNKI